ncbi:hypothetical protein [Massilia sp. S19_KUP03_FR1]|uniref:hypothetical protein n=1 Tax=Massilia sp. S19_KUP03_FR1 TaxID=3025503 RepID=UPI002FCD1E14
MRSWIKNFFLLCLLAWSALAGATNYSLWVNGRTGGGVVGNYASFNYFGPATVAAGVNKISANWDGRSSIASQSGVLRNALDCFCTGANWCYIATHSAGDLLVGYTLAQYGGSTRSVTAAVANGAGVCAAAPGGAQQTGWNIKWVRSAAGSAGGSELADAGAWAISEPLVQDQRVATARAMYNHNDTHNVWFYMYAGARGTLYSFLLPGQDDEVIAYHSAGGVAGSAGGAYCNPSDWFCNDLTVGPGPNQGGRPKWAFHDVVLRDDGERYRHYTGGNWDGITAPMRRDMELFAQ